MVTVKINVKPVVDSLKQKFAKLADREYLLRPVCLDMIDLMTKRIHVDGLDSDNSPIGEYSSGYMRVRTGLFLTNDVYKSGVNKGKLKPKGVFTKGEHKGQPRPNYQRSTDTKVIISLTRQLENDYAVIATDKGYAIGFLNPHNFDKSQWVQNTYNKKIFDLTKNEFDRAIEIINDLTSKAIQ